MKRRITSGDASNETPVTFTIDFGNSGIFQYEATMNGSHLNGDWQSASRSGIKGTISLEKQ